MGVVTAGRFPRDPAAAPLVDAIRRVLDDERRSLVRANGAREDCPCTAWLDADAAAHLVAGLFEPVGDVTINGLPLLLTLRAVPDPSSVTSSPADDGAHGPPPDLERQVLDLVRRTFPNEHRSWLAHEITYWTGRDVDPDIDDLEVIVYALPVPAVERIHERLRAVAHRRGVLP